jgi:putative transposase
LILCVLCETGEKILEKRQVDPKTTIGIDLGLKDLVTLSTGEKFSQPVRKMRNTKRLQRIISKRKLGSNRRKRLQKRLNKKIERETNRRNDLLHKVSSEITNRYDTLVVEDLNVRGMMRNHKLARSIGETGWSSLVNMLEYKCLWKGKNLLRVDRWFASSKFCSACGEKYSELRLNEREWTCLACGTIHDRDVNAAVNIKNWPVERRCQDVESGSVDERPVRTGPKKHPIGEALKVLELTF